MKNMIIPKPLKKGDLVAAVTLSWGGPGAYQYRYRLGKERVEKLLGIRIVEMQHTLKDPEWLKNNPKARADDLMTAFSDKRIKGIFSTIGGEDSIKLLKYIDIDVIKNNPKIFMGYSDTTITHMVCYRAGLISYYGPSIMAEFGENVEVFKYSVDSVRNHLFSKANKTKIYPSKFWVDEFLDWADKNNQNRRRKRVKSKGWDWYQGDKITKGHLLGGNIDTLAKLLNTKYFPKLREWNGSVFYFETSENKPSKDKIISWLRLFGSYGLYRRINALIVGRPVGNYSEEGENLKDAIHQIVVKEFKRSFIPIILNMNFGHSDPKFIIPNGFNAIINPQKKEIIIAKPDNF